MAIIGAIGINQTLNPDKRFATTALSNKNRAYAVNGEMILDKVSGELFIRRTDGKIISFHQNHKNIYDVLLELRVLLVNNITATYPKSSDSYLVIADYDTLAISGEDESATDILSNQTIALDVDGEYPITLDISTESSHIFIKPLVRDCDKALVNILTNAYDSEVLNYTGDDSTILAMQQVFASTSTTSYSNADGYISYIAYVGSTSSVYTAPMRFGELLGIELPSGCTSIVITKMVTKAYYVYNNLSMFDDSVSTAVSNFLYEDNQLLTTTFSVEYFTDDISSVEVTDYNTLIQLLDTDYMEKYMAKMQKLMDSSEVIVSDTEPDILNWTTNTMWVESINTIDDTGINPTEATFDFSDFETYIAEKL